jgi:hypothetical protein
MKDKERNLPLWLVGGAMFAVVGLLAWRVLAVNVAEHFAREPGREAVALQWQPHHPYALFLQGLTSARNEATPAALTQMRAALWANPASGRSYVILGCLQETLGNLQAAQAAMDSAALMAPRRTDVQMEVASFWMRHGDVVRALQHWDIALAYDGAVRNALFPELLQLAENPATLPAFAPLLKKPLMWWPAFFAYAADKARQVETVHALFALQQKGPNTIAASALRTFINRLQREGHWTDAYFVWLNNLPSDQVNAVGNLFNGGFEYPLSNLGFDWIINPAAQVTAETAATLGSTGSRALHVSFRGSKLQYRHLYQSLLLPAGRYTLRGRVRPESLETSQGLQWVIECRGSTQALATSERFLGSDQWRYFSTQFEVPEKNCETQTLRLELGGRTALDLETRGGIWFDDLVVEQQKLD